ncbi:hypothetical protein J422_03333 [Methanocaldococcus villosus KIN24-T80]|uniref:Diadenylate cyclase n=1 Tax=Methanocaldococcus villosus KIN24-T80 TaxID=1069083 RepID=N6VST4_9EURY|nr:diadenylate cyclase [Methanocaldococcus villosus]ENN96261.1 hypothetical protein J422_03333 [Methanocaldococcus villosus KIN24-T80]
MISKYIIKHGIELAYDIKAKAFLLFTESGKSYEILKSIKVEKSSKSIFKFLNIDKLKIIVITPNISTYNKLKNEKDIIPLYVRYKEENRQMIITSGVLQAIEQDLLKEKDTVVAVLGDPKLKMLDTIMVINIREHIKSLKIYKLLETLDEKLRKTFKEVLKLAIEIGREGREGKQVGTIFVIGDTLNVMNNSKPLILNPFAGHNAKIFDKDVKGTIKELCSIDGAFIITDDGKVVSAGRYLETKGNVKLPSGLGARHMAAADITKNTNAIAITVSQSGGIVRVFKDGEIVFELDPKKNAILFD